MNHTLAIIVLGPSVFGVAFWLLAHVRTMHSSNSNCAVCRTEHTLNLDCAEQPTTIL